MKTIDFYYSIGSRYSYLASTQIKAIEQEFNCRFIWHLVNSVRLIGRGNRNPFQGVPISGQYDWAYRQQDAERWAKLYNIPYREPRGKVKFNSELLALACTAAKCLGKVEEYSHLLFKAMFEDSLFLIDEKECILMAENCSIPRNTFQSQLKAMETTELLNTTIDRAFDFGVFGVPTFIVSKQLFWGNDRIILLRNYLKTNK